MNPRKEVHAAFGAAKAGSTVVITRSLHAKFASLGLDPKIPVPAFVIMDDDQFDKECSDAQQGWKIVDFKERQRLIPLSRAPEESSGPSSVWAT